MNTIARLNAMAISVAELKNESGHDFYTAFDTVFASSNFPEYEKEWVQREVGARMNWRKQMKRCRTSTSAPAKVFPPSPPKKAVQVSLMNIHSYPD